MRWLLWNVDWSLENNRIHCSSGASLQATGLAHEMHGRRQLPQSGLVHQTNARGVLHRSKDPSRVGARTQETGGNDWGVPRGHGQESGGRAESGCVLKTRKTGESAPLDPEGGSPSLFRSAPSLGSIDGAAGVFTPERDGPGPRRHPARLLVGRVFTARNWARAGAGPPLSGKPVFHSERLS